ncbi:hypothetical protein ACPXB3_22580, partial [Gordonia sp. DT219]|uniref:hypothetical protein n=1 Tax=Gordonia sp. DT219 TaxID=3416658 RepID=UPI003CF93678
TRSTIRLDENRRTNPRESLPSNNFKPAALAQPTDRNERPFIPRNMLSTTSIRYTDAAYLDAIVGARV